MYWNTKGIIVRKSIVADVFSIKQLNAIFITVLLTIFSMPFYDTKIKVQIVRLKINFWIKKNPNFRLK